MKIAFPVKNIVKRRIFLLLDFDSLASMIVAPNIAPKLMPNASKIDEFSLDLLNHVLKPHNNIPPKNDEKMTKVHRPPSKDLK